MDNSKKPNNINSKIFFAIIFLLPEVLFLVAGYFWVCILWAVIALWFAYPSLKKK